MDIKVLIPEPYLYRIETKEIEALAHKGLMESPIRPLCCYSTSVISELSMLVFIDFFRATFVLIA